MERVIKTTLVGDSASLEKAMDRVGAGSKDMAADLDKAAGDAKAFGSSIDRAAERSDASERTFMGTADVLDGLAAAMGLPIDRAVELGRAGGDLAGGFTSLAPAIKGLGASFNTLMTGPFGLVAGAIIAVGAALFVLYQKVEWFRDAVDAVLGPLMDVFGTVFSAIGDLFSGSGDDAEAMTEAHKKHLEELKTAYEEKLGRVTDVLDEMADPLQRFSHENEISLAEVVENLRFNVSEYEKWAEDIRVIRDRFGEETAQFVIDQGPEWHGLADQIANGTDASVAELTGLIGTLQTLEDQAGQTASGVQGHMARMAQQLRRDLDPVNELLGGIFYPVGYQPTMPVGPSNRSPVITKRHSGGIVPGPLGSEQPIVAQAGERVIPMGQGGGVTVVKLYLDGEEITEVVHDGLLAKQRRSGNLGIEAA